MSGQICSQHEWVDKIEALAPFTAGLNLRRAQNSFYRSGAQEPFEVIDPDAYNVANSSDHDALIQRASSLLQAKAGDAFVAHLLGEMTYRKTYGALSEMAAYDWLDQARINFSPQTPLDAASVVNPNGSTLDGKLSFAGRDVYFDIKGFGFVEALIEVLKKKLEVAFPGDEVLIDGVFSASIDDVQILLGSAGVKALVADLAATPRAIRGPLVFTRRIKRRVSISTKEINLEALAIANRTYAFKFGSQFVRNAPFVLFFVIHPWFTKGVLHESFGGFTDRFCSAFTKQTFLTFNQDRTLREGMLTLDLVKLLSAVAFINVWPQTGTAPSDPSARIYLNTNATHTLSLSDLATLQDTMGSKLSICQV